MFPEKNRSGLVIMGGCGLLLLAGCTGETITTVEVSGQVTLDGQALPSGAILFQPLSQGPSAGGSIKDGSFLIPRDDGPSPGPYQVEIVSYQPTGKKFPDPDRPGKMIDQLKPVIPERYNSNSELKADVSASEENQFEFALLTEP